MAKELKVDERTLKNEILRKVAIENLTNISKQRADMRQGIIPTPPERKSATELSEDRTFQATTALQNLLDLGFQDIDAQTIAGNLLLDQQVAFNRAYPQIKKDFEARFSVQQVSPEYFLEYLRTYLEALTATSGVPSNIAFINDNIITNPNDLLKLIITAEQVARLQNDLRLNYGLTRGSPLDLLLDDLQTQIPDSKFLTDLNLVMANDPVLGYRAIQAILTNMQSLPSDKAIKKILTNRAESNPQKRTTLLQKLGTLTPTNIAELNLVMTGISTSALTFAPPPPPPPPPPPTGSAPTGIPTPPVSGAMDLAGLDSILQTVIPASLQKASARKLKAGDSIPVVDLFRLDDGRPIYVGAYDNIKNTSVFFAIMGGIPTSSGTTMFSGEVLKDRIPIKLLQTILGQIIPYGKDLIDKISLAEGVPTKSLKVGNFQTYITRIGRPMHIDARASGAGIRDEAKHVYHRNHKKPQQLGLRAIKLGSGINIKSKNDPYKMYNEELGLNPISSEKEKKIKIKKDPTHKIKNGIDDGDEYAKFDDKENRYISFGKFAINMRQLKKCVLQVVYKSLAVNPNFPPKKISTELQQYLFELLANKKSMMSLYKHIPEEEKIMLERLAVFSGVFDKLNIPKINSLERENEEMERFKMLHGEFIAGNDNASMIRELRNLILKFLAESKITKAKAYDYLLELNNA
jgi:hypothetical protein